MRTILKLRRSWALVRVYLLCVAAALVSSSSYGQDLIGETLAFDAAARAFQDEVYDRAARQLAAFVQAYPNSDRVVEAKLLQARAFLALDQAGEALTVLTNQPARLGLWADQYQYWLAEAQLQTSNYTAAAESFATLIRTYPASLRLLDASYKEAWARFSMGDLNAVVGLLREPLTTFQKAARDRTNDVLVIDGHLLLSEALLGLQQFDAARKTLELLDGRQLSPEAKWRQHYNRCRIALAEQHLEAALNATTNLLVLATASGQRQNLAESVILQGSILEQLGDYVAAANVYERNLAEGVSDDRRRQSVLKIVELARAQGKLAAAIQRLENFYKANPKDAVSDLVLLTLGELHMRQHLAANTTNSVTVAAPVLTNQLSQAVLYFDKLLTDFPESPWAGKAALSKGWSLWEADKLAESQAAFQAAATRLPPSLDQAIAHFKWADTQMRQGDYTNALRNLRVLVAGYAGNAAVETNIFAHAYYQISRASLALNDLASATEAMQIILEKYPDSSFRDPGLLIVGQAVSAAGNQQLARAIYEQFIKQFPESTLLPEVSLAVAWSLVQEENWSEALQQYAAWLSQYPTNVLRARAQFNQAWVSSRADLETNALMLFTNFVAEFPNDQLNPLARYWVGDFYYAKKDYRNAHDSYQKLAETFPGQPLAWQARMMAGRAAFALGFVNDAVGPSGHFTKLLNDQSCPPEIVAEAFFAYGDIKLRLGVEGGQTKQRFDEAIVHFDKIFGLGLAPTNPLIPLAWGRIGDCHMQLAVQDPQHYIQATNAYTTVLQSQFADVTSRSQAAVGIGLVLEKIAQGKSGAEKESLLRAARDRYLDIVYGNVDDGGNPDAFWLKEAALAAARVAEELKEWEVAAKLYKRVLDRLPPLQAALERRLQRAEEQARQQAQ